MNIYTVSFFGHRFLEWRTEIENRLDKLLYNLIMKSVEKNAILDI